MKPFLTLLFSLFISSTIYAQNGLYVFGQLNNAPGYPVEVQLTITSNPSITTSFFTEPDGLINTFFIETPSAWSAVYATFINCNDTISTFFYQNPFPTSIMDVYLNLDYCDNGNSFIYGCTDPIAINYNPNATIDNGTCQYESTCDFNEVIVMMSTQIYGAEISWNLYLDSSLVYSGQNYSNNMMFTELLCLEDGCYTLEMLDSFGDGWNGAQIMIQYNGIVLYGGSLLTGNYGMVQFGLNTTICDPISIYGCTDPMALNYNPSATVEDSTCVYPQPVINDLCANATALLEGIQPISNLGAVNNENIWGDCWAFGSGEGEQTSIWFAFTTPAVPASIHIEALPDGTNSLTDTQFGIFENCGGEMIYCDGNAGQGLFSAFNFACGELAVNTTYILMIDGYFGDVGTCLLQYEVDTTCAPITGCTDVNALNYNPLATVDDESCIYPETCETNLIQLYIQPGTFPSEMSWNILNSDSMVVASGNANGVNGIGTGVSFLCLEDGCYAIELFDSFGDGWNGGMFHMTLNNTLIASGTIVQGNYELVQFGVNTSNCVTIYGCTDPAAINYNPNATDEDGTCIYPEICDFNEVIITIGTQQWGYEISWTITQDSMVVAAGNGYSNQSAYTQIACLEDGCYVFNMYDSFGDGWNGGSFAISMDGVVIVNGTLNTGNFGQLGFGINTSGCEIVAEVYGCTDPNALNYNPMATVNDGSCTYPEICDANLIQMIIQPGIFPSEIDWYILDSDSMVVAYGDAYGSNGVPGTGFSDICLEDGCYTIEMFDSFGDGWNNGSFQMMLNNTVIASGTLEDGFYGQMVFGVNTADCATVYGCTDASAVNYNPLATEDDGSCEYQFECGIDFTVIPDTLGENVIWIVPSANINQAAEVLWDFGDGTTSTDLFPTHTYAGDGPYTLCLTAFFEEPNGGYCAITYCAVLTYEMLNPPGMQFENGFTINIIDNSVVLSSGELAQVETIKIWPNPATEFVYLSYSLPQNSNVTIKILDVTGKLVQSFNNLGHAGTNNFNFNVQSLQSGMYFVEINSDSSTLINKIIVK